MELDQALAIIDTHHTEAAATIAAECRRLCSLVHDICDKNDEIHNENDILANDLLEQADEVSRLLDLLGQVEHDRDAAYARIEVMQAETDRLTCQVIEAREVAGAWHQTAVLIAAERDKAWMAAAAAELEAGAADAVRTAETFLDGGAA